MAIKDEIKWFKEQFAADVVPALAGTPLSFDLICAIAFQETGELWSKLRRHLPVADVLRLSVGDTLDAPNRSAFPKNKDALIAVENGRRMFDLAHELLVQMGDATGIEAYQHVAMNPNKFVHGYGIFQYDLQFFRRDPSFFLEQRWARIDACVEKMMTELKKALDQLGFANKLIAHRPAIGIRCDRLQYRLRQFRRKQGAATGAFRRHALLWREHRSIPEDRAGNPDAGS